MDSPPAGHLGDVRPSSILRLLDHPCVEVWAPELLFLGLEDEKLTFWVFEAFILIPGPASRIVPICSPSAPWRYRIDVILICLHPFNRGTSLKTL